MGKGYKLEELHQNCLYLQINDIEYAELYIHAEKKAIELAKHFTKRREYTFIHSELGPNHVMVDKENYAYLIKKSLFDIVYLLEINYNCTNKLELHLFCWPPDHWSSTSKQRVFCRFSRFRQNSEYVESQLLQAIHEAQGFFVPWFLNFYDLHSAMTEAMRQSTILLQTSSCRVMKENTFPKRELF